MGDFASRMIIDLEKFAESRGIVFSFVRDERDMMDFFDAQALFTGSNPPHTLVICSILSSKSVKKLDKIFPSATSMIDASMSGVPYRAVAGDLTFMAGGMAGGVGAFEAALLVEIRRMAPLDGVVQ